jgi:cytochrome c553
MRFVPLMVQAMAMAMGFAAPGLTAQGNVAAGQQKAEICQPCHGKSGVSAITGVPSLAGQQDQFLQWQLVFFRSGRRKNEQMSPMAAMLSDEDVRDLGAWFASLPPAPPAEEPDAAVSSAGAAIAAAHHCAVCHAENFTGKQAAARLTRQREDYLAKALTDYRSGARPSTGVAAMNEAASRLSDSDIAELARYLATLPK